MFIVTALVCLSQSILSLTDTRTRTHNVLLSIPHYLSRSYSLLFCRWLACWLKLFLPILLSFLFPRCNKDKMQSSETPLHSFFFFSTAAWNPGTVESSCIKTCIKNTHKQRTPPPPPLILSQNALLLFSQHLSCVMSDQSKHDGDVMLRLSLFTAHAITSEHVYQTEEPLIRHGS